MPKVPADQVITTKLVTARLFGHKPIARPRGLGDPTQINIYCRKCQRILVVLYPGGHWPHQHPGDADFTTKQCPGTPVPNW